MTSKASPRLTYADAGVDIDAGNALVERIKPLVRATRRRGADAEIGGFGGLFDLKAAGFRRSRAGRRQRRRRHQGQDRDRERHPRHDRHRPRRHVRQRLVVQGAEPLFFLDYFATGKLDPAIGAAIVTGIAARLRRSRLRADRRRDRRNAGPLRQRRLRSRRLRRRRGRARRRCCRARDLQAGDVAVRPAVLGRPFQRLFAGAPDRRARRPDLGRRPRRSRRRRSLAEALLEPTRLYVQAAAGDARKAADGMQALAHITGGGFPDNLPRVLPEGAGGACSISPPSRRRRCSPGCGRPAASPKREMLRTFNCGIGMVVFAAAEAADAAIAALAADGLAPMPIGKADRRATAPRVDHARDGSRCERPAAGSPRSFPGAAPTWRRWSRRRGRRISRPRSRSCCPTSPARPASISPARRASSTEVVEYKAVRRPRRRSRRALQATLEAHRIEFVCLAGFMRVLDAVVRRALARAHAQHPPVAAAGPARPAHARARARRRREGARLHRPFRRARSSTPARSSPRRAVPVLPDDDAETLGGAGAGRGAPALSARGRRSRGEACARRQAGGGANATLAARRAAPRGGRCGWRRCGFVTELSDGWGGSYSRSGQGAAGRQAAGQDGRQEGEEDGVRNGRRRRRAAGSARIARAVHQPRAVLAGVQPPGAGGSGQPQPSAARAAALPVDLGQQSRRILHGPRRRPGRPGARRRDGDLRRRPHAGRAARAHRRAGRRARRRAAGALARAARRARRGGDRHLRRRRALGPRPPMAGGLFPSPRLPGADAAGHRPGASRSRSSPTSASPWRSSSRATPTTER